MNFLPRHDKDFSGRNTTQVVDEGDRPVGNHGEELNNNNQPIHEQEHQLEGSWINAVSLQLAEAQGQQEDNPHEVHEEENSQHEVSQAHQRLLDIFDLRKLLSDGLELRLDELMPEIMFVLISLI